MSQWLTISSESDLDAAIDASQHNDIILFKHSMTCSISSIAKRRLDEDWSNDNAQLYYLDLLAHRNISNLIAEKFDVHHESPQALIIKKGICIYDTSHLDITVQELLDGLKEKA